MAPRKRRGAGRVKGSITVPPNTRGLAALSDEIYLEIVSHIPSIPIPTSIDLESYPEIRRSRHETFLSLSQTSRSLRRFFWRYLWQYIEVREGMKIGDKDDTLKGTRTRTRTAYLSNSADRTGHKKYAIELVRQLEIVTVRNPQLAQYVNYLDIFIGEYSIVNILAELARCLSLFSNLHTVQIDVVSSSTSRLSLGDIFEQTFKNYSYPQIRNVFVKSFSVSFVASCPQARRVGVMPHWALPRSCLQTILGNCPHLEVLEDFEVLWRPDASERAFLHLFFSWHCIEVLTHSQVVVNNFPNLRSIQLRIFPALPGDSSNINILKNLNHLQTIIMRTPRTNVWHSQEQRARSDRVKEDWIESAKRILIQIQLRDNLEKTVVVQDYDGNERRILIKPKSSFDFEGSFT